MLPLFHLSMAGRAAQQQHNTSGSGVWGCGSGSEAADKLHPSDFHRVTVEWRWRRRRTPDMHTHTHIYADSPVHAQPVSVAVPPLPLVHGSTVRQSEDTRGTRTVW
eukprot:GHVU01212021.1.p1 GENE.GHVU01212021.1~~GHVU01212021.1.p1  ORF type:complete len:106 (-),score=9.78 GHVU01212021.1:128-445(-)